jgi:YidC/Oxa1 family membrane protein insertase
MPAPLQDFFNVLFIYPITNVLIACYQLLIQFGVPYALGFAIILLTIVIRLLVYPLASAQIKSTKEMQAMSPKIAAVREKYKDDKKRQQEEMMKLYKEHNMNPAAGCLPILIQIPIFISLYNVLTTIVAVSSVEALEKINSVLYSDQLRIAKLWDPTFFGVPLSATPSGLWTTMPIVTILIPLLTAILQFILSKMMVPADQPKTPPKKDDFQAAFQTQSLYIFPLFIGFFSFTLPVGLSLYWNTFTIFGILQQYLLAGPGGLESLFKSKKLAWKK